MTEFQWDAFCKLRNNFEEICNKWNEQYSELLIPLQIQASNQDSVPNYPIQNPILFNSALNDVSQNNLVKLILVGDNPGKNEQLNINRKYLVGLSGKIANNFFLNHPELEIDFRENVLILNKTPIHTAKTKELSFLAKQNSDIAKLLIDSQIYMIRLTLQLQQIFNCPLWIVGYSELHKKGLFSSYQNELINLYNDKNYQSLYSQLFIYQHFSMNRFSIDLSNYCNLPENKTNNIQQNLNNLGYFHKSKLFNK